MLKNATSIQYNAVSFAGCGTLNFYQVGVLAALQAHNLDSGLMFAGASAGAGLCVLAAAGIPAREITQVAAELLKPHARKNILKNYRVPIDFGREFLQCFKQKINIESQNNRIGISITQLRPYRNLLVTQFRSNDEILDAVRASCHLPSFRYPYVRFRGAPCIDGGVSWNNPTLGEHCLRISPLWMDRRAHISPSVRISPWWGVHVPPTNTIWRMFETGHQDGLSWIRKSDGLVKSFIERKRLLRHLRGKQIGL